MTVTQMLLMLLLGASFFDALTHTFSTVSTGGFSPYADSVAHFSGPLQAVILVFMLAAGVNFSLYYSIASRRDLRILARRRATRLSGSGRRGLARDRHRPAA